MPAPPQYPAHQAHIAQLDARPDPIDWPARDERWASAQKDYAGFKANLQRYGAKIPFSIEQAKPKSKSRYTAQLNSTIAVTTAVDQVHKAVVDIAKGSTLTEQESIIEAKVAEFQSDNRAAASTMPTDLKTKEHQILSFSMTLCHECAHTFLIFTSAPEAYTVQDIISGRRNAGNWLVKDAEWAALCALLWLSTSSRSDLRASQEDRSSRQGVDLACVLLSSAKCGMTRLAVGFHLISMWAFLRPRYGAAAAANLNLEYGKAYKLGNAVTEHLVCSAYPSV